MVAIITFFVMYFAGMLLLGLPMIFSIGAAAITAALCFGSTTAVTLANIGSSFANALFSGSTGLTILLFIISGEMMSRGKITGKIFNVFAYFLGKCRGFMPLLSIATCMMFGAISGSAPGTVAAVGALCYPLLVELGYEPVFAGATIMCAGVLGCIIPPSIAISSIPALTGGLEMEVIYQIAAIMGVACGLLMMVYCYIYCLRHGNGDQEKINAWVDDLRTKGLVAVVKESIWAFLCPVIILGSIFLGIAEVEQAAAISLVYAIFVSVFIYKSIKPSELLNNLVDCFKNSAGVLVMVAFATVLSQTMVNMGTVTIISNIIVERNLNAWVILALCMVMIFVLGFCNAVSTTLTIPLFYPLIVAGGLEPYTAIMGITLVGATAQLTPPVGLGLFVMQPMVKCSLGELGKKAVPYILIYVLVAVVCSYFPDILSFLTAGAYVPGI